MSRWSPGRKVPPNCELSPISRDRASRARPTATCWRSQLASAAGTSPPAAVEFLGEGPAVVGGLGRARGRVRADREGGVADQADPAERHPGDVDVVDDLDERLGHAGHDLGDRRGQLGCGGLAAWRSPPGRSPRRAAATPPGGSRPGRS